jgi:hypothetical protein
MANESNRETKGTRQTRTTGMEREAQERQPRLSPGRTPGKADGEEDPSAARPDDAARRGYHGNPAGAGVTDLPPDAEESQQEQLPPRGERKSGYHA